MTGGAGFIGSHLAEALLACGHRVHILDDLLTGSIDNVRHLKSDPRFSYTIEHARERIGRCRARRRSRCRLPPGRGGRRGAHRGEPGAHDRDQRALHRGRPRAGREEAQAGPARVDERGLRQVEVLSVSRGRRPRHGPLDDRPLVLRLLEGDRRVPCAGYWKERKLPTVVARLFNTVGPRQTGRYGMVVPTFVAQALSGRPLTVFGDGTQTRCFCHVDDVVPALVALMLLGEAAYGDVFNIGSQEEISIMGLADRVRELTASESEIHISPYEEAYEAGFEDMPRRYPDVAKIGGALGGWRRGRWTTSSGTSSATSRLRRQWSKQACAQPPRSRCLARTLSAMGDDREHRLQPVLEPLKMIMDLCVGEAEDAQHSLD
ncbi:MAG: NAD-dependent epimerase/dehydratase family protein [Solirubrobacteraceae bacterium]